MLGTKREEVTVDCGKLHEKLHDLYPTLNINPLSAELNPTCHLLALLGAHHIFHIDGLRVNGVIRSSNIRCAVHVAGMRERESAYRIFFAKLDGKTPLEDLSADGNTEENLNEIRYEGL